MKNSFKILAASITVLVLCSFGVTACFAHETDVQTKIMVQSTGEFAQVVSTAKDGVCIVLNDDIFITNPIEIKVSITVDLNGHKITVEGDDHGIVCGDRVFDHTEYYTIEHPGRYVTESHRTWSPGYWYTNEYGVRRYNSGTWVTTYSNVWKSGGTETCANEIYRYFDNINIVLKNGYIVQTSAKNGKHGKKDVDVKYNGEDGKSKNAPVKVLSGNLSLINMKIQAANGGNGGNGGYQSLWHAPFGGGDAGKGGNGGDGAFAIEINSEHAKVFVDKNSSIIAGKGGKGGLRGKQNPNYWLWSGEDAVDGVAGKNVNISNDMKKLYM